MSGLIKHDLMQIASGIKGGFFIGYMLLFGVISLVSQMSTTYGYMMIFLAMGFGTSAFQYDERSHWDRYTASMPLTVRQIVLSRYLYAIICVLIGAVIAEIIAVVSSLAGNMEMSMFEWTISVLICIAIALIYLEVMIPLMYRFGGERGRLFMLAFFALILGGVFGLASLFPDVDLRGIVTSAIGIGTITIVGFPISVFLSERIRRKKEF